MWATKEKENEAKDFYLNGLKKLELMGDEDLKKNSYGLIYANLWSPEIEKVRDPLLERLKKYEQKLKEEKEQSSPVVELIKASCGCSVPKILLMSTSTGTSCDRCYDRMSEG